MSDDLIRDALGERPPRPATTMRYADVHYVVGDVPSGRPGGEVLAKCETHRGIGTATNTFHIQNAKAFAGVSVLHDQCDLLEAALRLAMERLADRERYGRPAGIDRSAEEAIEAHKAAIAAVLRGEGV